MSNLPIRKSTEPESDAFDALPPLEPDEGEGEAPAFDDLTGFLERFPDDEGLDEEEEVAEDLDVGVDVAGVESEAEPDAEPLELDLRSLVQGEETAPGESGDEFGPTAFDITVGLDADPSDLGVDDTEGSGTGTEVVLGEELPPLDADAEGELEGIDGAIDLPAAAEGVIPQASHTWRELEPRLRVEAVSALSVAEGHALAGSGDLLWIQAGTESALRVAAGDSRLTSVALLGAARDSALCATATGRLLRRSRLGPATQLIQFRDAAGLAAGQAASLTLCQHGADRGGSVLLLLGTGKLLASDDFGTTFRALETPGRVLALTTRAAPPMALIATRAGLELWNVDQPPATARQVPARARAIADGVAPLLAAQGSAVAIAESERGTVVSSDGGGSFSIAPGCINVTALEAGISRGRTSVWAAVYRETEDATDIVEIDPSTLAIGVIARVGARAAAEGDPADGFEQARVERLAWDEGSEQLWAAGGFGILRLGPP